MKEQKLSKSHTTFVLKLFQL